MQGTHWLLALYSALLRGTRGYYLQPPAGVAHGVQRTRREQRLDAREVAPAGRARRLGAPKKKWAQSVHYRAIGLRRLGRVSLYYNVM